jgi:hypothetical protein
VTIKTLLAAHDQGYGTVLSLKFPYNNREIPSPHSTAMAAELALVDKVMHSAMGKVDIVAIGNEPFIESLPGDRNATLNAFYEKIPQHVISYRKKTFGRTARPVSTWARSTISTWRPGARPRPNAG